MNIYKNPSWIVRMIIIATGLVLCAVAGAAQSILFLIVGLSISIFGVAVGSKEYIDTLISLGKSVKVFIVEIFKK